MIRQWTYTWRVCLHKGCKQCEIKAGSAWCGDHSGDDRCSDENNISGICSLDNCPNVDKYSCKGGFYYKLPGNKLDCSEYGAGECDPGVELGGVKCTIENCHYEDKVPITGWNLILDVARKLLCEMGDIWSMWRWKHTTRFCLHCYWIHIKDIYCGLRNK